MKTALDKVFEEWFTDNDKSELTKEKWREVFHTHIEPYIKIALQDFGEKIRSKLRNQEDIMILEDIMLKEGLK